MKGTGAKHPRPEGSKTKFKAQMKKKMKSQKLKVVVFCLAALAALFVSSSAKADAWNVEQSNQNHFP